jgi:hypothetical protein
MACWQVVIVLGSLQGRFKEEPDRSAGTSRIREALQLTQGKAGTGRRLTRTRKRSTGRP